MNEETKCYRDLLRQADKENLQEYDKSILALSGGGIAISFAFLEQLGGKSPDLATLALAAWLSWGLSIASVLVSFILAHHSLRIALRQIETGGEGNEAPGGKFTVATTYFNYASGSLFLLGMAFIFTFAFVNLEKAMPNNPDNAAPKIVRMVPNPADSTKAGYTPPPPPNTQKGYTPPPAPKKP